MSSARGKLTVFFTVLFSVMLILALGLLTQRVHKTLKKDFQNEIPRSGGGGSIFAGYSSLEGAIIAREGQGEFVEDCS